MVAEGAGINSWTRPPAAFWCWISDVTLIGCPFCPIWSVVIAVIPPPRSIDRVRRWYFRFWSSISPIWGWTVAAVSGGPLELVRLDFGGRCCLGVAAARRWRRWVGESIAAVDRVGCRRGTGVLGAPGSELVDGGFGGRIGGGGGGGGGGGRADDDGCLVLDIIMLLLLLLLRGVCSTISIMSESSFMSMSSSV